MLTALCHSVELEWHARVKLFKQLSFLTDMLPEK